MAPIFSPKLIIGLPILLLMVLILPLSMLIVNYRGLGEDAREKTLALSKHGKQIGSFAISVANVVRIRVSKWPEFFNR